MSWCQHILLITQLPHNRNLAYTYVISSCKDLVSILQYCTQSHGDNKRHLRGYWETKWDCSLNRCQSRRFQPLQSGVAPPLHLVSVTVLRDSTGSLCHDNYQRWRSYVLSGNEIFKGTCQGCCWADAHHGKAKCWWDDRPFFLFFLFFLLGDFGPLFFLGDGSYWFSVFTLRCNLCFPCGHRQQY